MSGKRQRAQSAANSLANREFYILPQPGSSALVSRITSHAGKIAKDITAETLILVEDESPGAVDAQHLTQLANSHTIYKAALVEALIQSPDAMNEEENILVEARATYSSAHPRSMDTTTQAENVEGQAKTNDQEAVKAREAANRAQKADARRHQQLPPDELDLKCREWLSRGEEEYIEKYYSGTVPPTTRAGERKMFHKECEIPPPLPGCQPRPYGPGTRFRDCFFAPPIALSDAVRAADPSDRNYGQSEDFAILIWFTRTIPYCGAVGGKLYPVDAVHPRTPQYKRLHTPSYSSYRWNWARTHGIVLRPLLSVYERWRKCVQGLFEGEDPVPEGTFRRFVAQCGFFWFAHDKIVGFRIANIKQANERCRLGRDAPADPFCIVDDDDKAFDRELKEYLRGEYGDDLHDGSLFLEAAAAAAAADEMGTADEATPQRSS